MWFPYIPRRAPNLEQPLLPSSLLGTAWALKFEDPYKHDIDPLCTLKKGEAIALQRLVNQKMQELC